MATEPRGILVPAYDRPGHPTRSDGAIEPTNETTRPNCGPHGARGSEQDCHSADTDLSSITRDRTEIGRPALPEADLVNSVPFYFIFGAESAMRSVDEFHDALKQSRRRAPKARKQAKEITDGLPEGMVTSHSAFLPDVGRQYAR